MSAYQSEAELAQLVRSFTKRPKVDIGPELLYQVAVWGRLMQFRTASNFPDATHIHFAHNILWGRLREIQHFAWMHPGEDARDALDGIRKVYDFVWPNNYAGVMFAGLWGWAQVELGKPGMSSPISRRRSQRQVSFPLQEGGCNHAG